MLHAKQAISDLHEHCTYETWDQSKKHFADEPAKASTTEAAPEAAATPNDSFCQLVGANLSRDAQCLDDWRLQMLELLPAAGIQLTQVQVCTSLASQWFRLSSFGSFSASGWQP